MATILLVEDDRNQRELYRRELTEEGYEVHAVGDGPAALESVRGQRPDAIVMDVALPGMDGMETLGRLLGIDETIPVVLNTAYAHYRHNFLSWAAEGYVVKSSDLEPLKSKLREVLGTGAGVAAFG